MNPRMQIVTFLEEFFILDGRLDQLGDEASFLENGIVDSTGMLEIVLFLEETFGFEVEDDEVVPANFDSVSRLLAYVTRKQQTSPIGCLDAETA